MSEVESRLKAIRQQRRQLLREKRILIRTIKELQKISAADDSDESEPKRPRLDETSASSADSDVDRSEARRVTWAQIGVGTVFAVP
jgi:ethanolamine utilization cobalamin adenosyltransferase